MFKHDIFLKGRKDLLPYITRNQKKMQRDSVIEFTKTEAKKALESCIENIYGAISKIQREQLMLEDKVSELEHRTEQIDLRAHAMMTDFYKR